MNPTALAVLCTWVAGPGFPARPSHVALAIVRVGNDYALVRGPTRTVARACANEEAASMLASSGILTSE